MLLLPSNCEYRIQVPAEPRLCRVRPAGKTGDSSASCVDFGDEGQLAIYSDQRKRSTFTFDKVFDPRASQSQVRHSRLGLQTLCSWQVSCSGNVACHTLLRASCPSAFVRSARAIVNLESKEWVHLFASALQVYIETQPLIRSVLDGYNVCIFAYGQTGSGKTHTMSGTDVETVEGRGINYRALDDLFDLQHQRAGETFYRIKVQMLEVYNEAVRGHSLLSFVATVHSGCRRCVVRCVHVLVLQCQHACKMFRWTMIQNWLDAEPLGCAQLRG